MSWRRDQAYGLELRGRVLAACDSWASVREVADRPMVSPSYVVKVRQRRDETGEMAARSGTGRPPSKIAAHLEPLRERTLRRLPIISASAVVCKALREGPPAGSWLERMLARKPRLVAIVAIANKMARAAWAWMAKREIYRAPAVAA